MLMQILEYVLIVLLMLLSVAVIVGFFIYTGLDKRRFRVERQLDKVLPIMKKWLTLAQGLSEAGVLGGAPEVPEACRAFLATKKLPRRLAALDILAQHHRDLTCRLGADQTPEQAEQYADFQACGEMLRDFFGMYPIMSREYNRCLDRPVYRQAGKLMRFFPLPDLSGLCD